MQLSEICKTVILLGCVYSSSAIAQDACRTEGRFAIDKAHAYESAVRNVIFSCTKDDRPCVDAKAEAELALLAISDAHVGVNYICDNAVSPPPPPGGSRGQLIINEVDYDQPVVDSQEFVEIYNIGTETANLNGVAVVFVNGGNNAEYLRIGLNGNLMPGQYAVITSVNVAVAADALVFPFPVSENNIQNGSPDGIAIIDTVTMELLDAISYEGAIESAQIIGFDSPVNLVEGTPPASSDVGEGSLIRWPNGMDTNNASADWTLSTTPTPGGENSL